MENPFYPRALVDMPWSPIAFWQANLQVLSSLQQAWLQMFMPNVMGGAGSLFSPFSGMAGLGTQWAAPEFFMGGLMPFMPKIEATITPLEREGSLAGAEDASRVTMRMTVPGLGGQGAPEVLVVDAVVARAAGPDSLPLDNSGLPADPGNSDLPAALPKKD